VRATLTASLTISLVGVSNALAQAPTATPVGLDPGAWPAFLRTPRHAGVAPVSGPTSGRLRWRRRLEGPIAPGPAVASNGVAYVASNAGVLHAIRISDGRDLWRFEGHGGYGSDLSTVPVLLSDGIVLWPGSRHTLFALSSGGRALWRVTLTDDLLSPAIDASRRLLYIADQSGVLRAYRLMDPARRPVKVWQRTLPGGSLGSPAIAPDGTLYETAGGSLYALTSAGRVRWRFRTRALVEVSPAVADDGTVVFGSNDTVEYGVGPDGHLRWRYRIGAYTYSSPSVLPGNRVAFGDHLGNLNFLDAATGGRLARVHGSGQIWTAAAIDGNGDSYFATRHGHVYGFGPMGQRLFDRRFTTTFDSYPALAADGTLLIGTDDGRLLAFADH
jgi:outer membrane protein assembly factor BamB